MQAKDKVGPNAMPTAGFTTEELARLTRVRPASIRVSLCRSGHYCGMRPVKLPNRRLLWPAAAVERLLSGL